MLKIIIDHINSRISATSLFEKKFGLCEKITKDGKSFPAYYCNNEYKQVGEFDKYNGLVYHRLMGAVITTELDEDQATGCDPFYERSFPIRTVAVIKKSELGISNDAYLESRIAQDFLAVIAGVNNKSLRIALGVDSVNFEVSNLILDRKTIFDSEYSDIDNFFRYEYMYIAIEYNVIISGSISCFHLIC